MRNLAAVLFGGWTLASAVAAEPSAFVEVAAETGLDYVHFNGMSGELYMAENLGPGVAFLDYDGDGDLDVFFPQGTILGKGKTVADALVPPHHPVPLTDRLYRNDLAVGEDGRRHLHFTDVTEAAGLRPDGYGMGVAAGDYDSDGFVDLYVTRLGDNQLLHNEGDGTFSDVTAAAGAGDTRWSVSAAFLDYDRDGRLDVYVGNYVGFTVADHKPCYGEAGGMDYCGPVAYPPLQDRLLHNRGDGTFEEVTSAAGVDQEYGSTLGVIDADFDGDGWLDVYVANDELPNQLWRNRHDGTFENIALLGGCSVNEEGMAESSMGVDAADFDGDGDEDLFMSHLSRQTNTLYVNDGTGLFDDRTVESSLGAPSWKYTGFGLAFFDYDNDGWLDLLVVNGAVRGVGKGGGQGGDPYDLGQPNQLFRNRGGGHFEEVTAGGPAFAVPEVSRGATFGDLDLDGDTDVVIANNNEPAQLLENGSEGSTWLRLELQAAAGSPALGARAEVRLPSGRTLWRRARADGSYASANDPSILVGLGGERRVEAVAIHWLDGGKERWLGVPEGHTVTLRRKGGSR